MSADISDEVMKRRLLIDGDGAGDDRRILGLTRSFLSWCANEETEEESKVSYRRLVNQMNQIEHGHEKTHFAIQINEEATSYYSSLDEQVKDEIEKAKEQIEDYKELLEKAKENRKNRTEYNALARIIKTKPDRTDTELKRLSLENDLQVLQDEKTALDDRLEQRKKNMQVLVSAIYNLGDLLDQEDELGRQAIIAPQSGKSNLNLDHQPQRQRLDGPSSSYSSPMDTMNDTLKSKIDAILSVDSNASNTVEPMSICDSDQSSGNSGSIIPVSSNRGENGHTSNPGSPIEQVAQEEGSHIESLGTVSSAPCSPKEKSLEKYDDLSESDTETGEQNE